MSTLNSYFVIDNNGQQIPEAKTAETIFNLVQTNVISKTNLAWCAGMDDWKPIDTITEIKLLIDPPRPPPPTASKQNIAPPPPPKVNSISNSNNNSNNNNNNNSNLQKLVVPKKQSFVSNDTNGWAERVTSDGVAYYHNFITDAVTWDKPFELKSEAERRQDDGEWVWLSDPTEAWIPVKVQSRNGNKVTVLLPNGSSQTVTSGNNEPLWQLAKSSLKNLVDDLVMVDFLNPAQIIYLLKSRYQLDHIYTWVGASHTVLVSINPFKQLPIYTVNTMTEFANPSPNKLDPPHTFAIASSAFYNMRSELHNQAILISGESGAGKTEATKQCFNFLAEKAGSETGLEQKILNANPVLEAFGNAKTLRNNNSSRFGRWTAIHFDSKGHIIGASIENYLLEKSRVVYQSQGERNYHIFYQLCECKAEELGLDAGPNGFRYLNRSGCTTAAGINDRSDFQDLVGAFSLLDFSDDDVNWIFETCAGLLHLSNVSFIPDGEGSAVNPNNIDNLDAAAIFLKVDSNKLCNALIQRTIEIRGEINHILHRVKEAQEAADALSKAIYNELFNWLVMRINASVEGTKGHFIGVLDIFGFEIFEKNSFEQLCINYTNEKLQQHFNSHTFKDEEKTYQDENITYQPVVFIDNQPVLDLIEKKPHGLLNLLDEEVRLPKGDEDKWLSKCQANHQTNGYWIKDQSVSKSSFIVVHYAGQVIYDSLGFCDKNKDSVFRDLYDLMSTANHPNYNILFPEKDKNPRRTETLSSGFRKQLNNLMDVCNSTHPHYIRCIKPNSLKVPKTFDSKMSLEQLTYAGVFEAVQIRKTGYPFRLIHEKFAKKYRYLLKKKYNTITLPLNEGLSYKDCCELILTSIPSQDFSNIQLGRTMVLYRAEEHRILELLRNLYLDKIYSIIQRHVRKYISKKYIKVLKRIKMICLKVLNNTNNDINTLSNAINISDEALGQYKRIYHYEPYFLLKCREKKYKLEERQKINIEFNRIKNLSVMEHFSEYDAIISRADKIIDVPGTQEDIELEKLIRNKLRNAACEKLEPMAQQAIDNFDLEAMRQVFQEAQRYTYTSSKIEILLKWITISNRIDPIASNAYDSYNKIEMEKILNESNSLGYTSTCLVKIQEWLSIVEQIELNGQSALNTLNKIDLETVLKEAEYYTYNSDTIVEIKQTLGLSEDKFVRKQLVRAKELGDEDRRINREIRLKDIFLDMHKVFFQFNSSCQLLRNDMDWASTKLFVFGKAKIELAEGMLKHTNQPIHQTLTILDNSKDNNESIRQFKNLMGYMGDRKYQYPDTLAVEFINSGLQGSQGLQTELYAQLMKQLTSNPSNVSQLKGWEMMIYLLSCIPPPSTIENYVLMFIRENSPIADRDRYMLCFHLKMYASKKVSSIVLEDLTKLKTEFKERRIDQKFLAEDFSVATISSNIAETARKMSTTSIAPPSLSLTNKTSLTTSITTTTTTTTLATITNPAPPPPSSSSSSSTTLNQTKDLTESREVDFHAMNNNGNNGNNNGDDNQTQPSVEKEKHKGRASIIPSNNAVNQTTKKPIQINSEEPIKVTAPSSIGSAPPPPPPPPKLTEKTAIVLYDYVPETEGISLSRGEIIVIVDTNDPNWWLVRNSNGSSGWAPATFLQLS